MLNPTNTARLAKDSIGESHTAVDANPNNKKYNN